MRWKTILTIVVIIIVAIPVAAIAVLMATDFNEYRDDIALQVEQATGRKLTIAGNLDVVISTRPSVSLGEVSFANAAGGSREQMLTLKSLAVEARLWPLLRGQVIVDRIAIDGLDVLLERLPDGTANWEIAAPGQPAAKPDDAGAPVIPFVAKLDLTNATIAFVDGPTKLNVALDSVALASADPRSPVTLKAAGTLNRAPLTLDATLGSIDSITNPSEPFTVKLAATLAAIAANIQGRIADPIAAQGIDLKVDVAMNTLRDLAVVQPEGLPDLGPVKVTLGLKQAGQAFRMEGLDAQIGSPNAPLHVSAIGGIADLLVQKGIDIAFNAAVPDLAALGRALDSELPAMPPITVTGKAGDIKGGYRISDLKLKIGASDINGKLAVVIDAKVPAVVADLNSNLIDVDSLLPKADGQASAAAPAPSDGRVIPNTPIPLGALGVANADISFNGALVKAQGIELRQVLAKLNLKDGVLKIDPVSSALAGGSVGITGTLDGSGDKGAVDLNIKVEKLNVGILAKQLAATDLIEGALDAKVSLRGSGGTVRELAGNLDGGVNLVMGEGTIASKYVDLIAADVLATMASWGAGKEDTKVNCLVVDYDIKRGLATSKVTLFDTARMTMVGEGNVSLRSEQMQLQLKPRPKDPSLVSLAVPINVEGTMAEPSIGVDKAAAATGVGIAVIGNILLPGAGLLAPLLSTGTGDEHPCLKVVQAGGAPARPAARSATQSATQPATQPAAKKDDTETDNPIGSLLKGLGGKIDNVLGVKK